MQPATMKSAALLMALMMLLPMAGAVGAQEQPPAANVPDEAGAAVTFSDQISDGMTVTVDAVNTTDGGFVAIHDSSLLEGDAVGSVVGVSPYLEPGLHENVTVTLFDVPGGEFDRTELTENQTLIAMPHQDTNANETFDFVRTNGAVDGPYLDNETPVTDAANVTVEPAELTTGESFDVSELTAPQVVEQGDEVQVNATITNPNDAADTQEVEYRFDGEVLVREEISLEPGESTTFTTTVNTTEKEMALTFHGVYTRDRGAGDQIRIVEEIQSFHVSNLTAPETVSVGENLTVTATVTNPNEFPVTQPVQYRFDGNLVETQSVAVDGEDSETVEFQIATDDLELGTYIHSVFSIDFGQNALITVDTVDDTDEGDEADEGDETDEQDEQETEETEE